MSKQNSKFWWYWLLLTTDGVVLFGLALMFLPNMMLRLFNVLFFGVNEGASMFGALEGGYLMMVYSVLGAVMVGWGVMIFFVLFNGFKRGERDAWYAMAVSLTVWFVLDTTFSIMHGFAANAALNSIFYVLYLIPLAATYKQFANLASAQPRPQGHLGV